MKELKSLDGLSIETLTTVIKYPIRGDFALDRRKLIPAVCKAVNTELREKGLSGVVESKVDSDGDVVFQYDSIPFHFQLDCRPNLAGGQFKRLNNHQLALTILETYLAQIADVFDLDSFDVFTVDFRNVFHLTEDTKNYDIFEERLMSNMRKNLSLLMKEANSIGRIEFKIGWDYDTHYTCYYSVECPGNEKNTTIWTTLNLRTREDVEATKKLLDVRKCYEVYIGPYAAQLVALLDGIKLDIEKLQVESSS